MKNLKYKIELIFFFLLVVNINIAQRTKRNSTLFNEKYFISLAFGTGEAIWNSEIKQSALYDTSGSELFSDYLQFTANNSLKNLNVEVAAQLNQIRLGLGLSFEDFFLEKIRVNNINYSFPERFTFSKLFAGLEIPIERLSRKKFSLNFKSSLGYYGVYNLNRINFFGSATGGDKYFLNIGLLTDYKFINHIYLFAQPVLEFKYFRSSKKDEPQKVSHNIWSYFILLGLRIDVGKI